MTNDYAFPFVDLPPSRMLPKRRGSGVTMVADWGSSNRHVDDMLRLVGPYVDFAKIVTGTSRLYDRDYLKERIEIYNNNQISAFIGGQFFEYILANYGWDGMPRFFAEARALGFTTIEISENCIAMSPDERINAITLARSHELAVMVEVGSKDKTTEIADVVATIDELRHLEIEYFLLEAAEVFVQGAVRRRIFDEIVKNLSLEAIMFELPGPWISGITNYMVHDLRKLLVEEFGPDVNLANIHFDEVIATEALRCNLGVVGPVKRIAEGPE